ncbi:Uncharacterised protein [Candidatus Gugararchaeum adminiculabundum]|nr:Uncharacterised protein [Candidatus Gugararchaeum adminiculabundum]
MRNMKIQNEIILPKSAAVTAASVVTRENAFWLNQPLLGNSPFFKGKGQTVPGERARKIASMLEGGERERAAKGAGLIWVTLAIMDGWEKGIDAFGKRSAEQVLEECITDLRFWCADFSQAVMAVALAAGIPARLSMVIAETGRLHFDAEVFIEGAWLRVKPPENEFSLDAFLPVELGGNVVKGACLADFGVMDSITLKRFVNGSVLGGGMTVMQMLEISKLRERLDNEYRKWYL